jgi:hypothetical protein
MSAKLRSRSTNVLRVMPPPRGLLGRGAPHVLYANMKFGAGSSRREVNHLLDWLHPFPSRRWTEKRVLRFLEKHQAGFRRCLEWLSSGSPTQLAEPSDDEKETDEFWEVALSERWHLEPEANFLQQHGLDHGGVVLGPYSQDGSTFLGLELEQREPRDPLDPICWYMLSLLMWDGSVNVSRCNYPKCRKFIYRPTARREFCGNNCRAKNGADKKTPEQKRKYMKEYRSLPGVKKRELKQKSKL